MSSSLRRVLTVAAPLGAVAAYLSDLTTAVEWDAHTVECRRLDDGPVVVGSRYEQRRTFGRWTVELTAEVVEHVVDSDIAWISRTRFGEGTERFRFTGVDAAHTEVAHEVTVELLGHARVGRRMVPEIMRRIADDGTPLLRRRLERLG